MRMRSRLHLGLVTALGLALLLVSCSPAPPQSPTDDRIDLEGLWLVTPATGTTYGAGGTTTLEFGAASSGNATFLSQAEANEVKTCEHHVYVALTDSVVLLNGTYYVATVSQAGDQIVLERDASRLTLDRVTGTPPVTPCPELHFAELDILDVGVGGFSQLNAFQTRLYFNIDAPSSPLVGYDISGTLGTPRTYNFSVSGGTHRWVIGARSDALFYGHCGCGGSTTVDHFNLDLDTSVAAVETTAGLGVNFSVRYGYFDGAAMVIGGRRLDAPGVNELLTVNADTLALVSRRQILPAANIKDVALVDGQLYALVGRYLVEVGSNGRAAETFKLMGVASSAPRGVTGIGRTVYILDSTATAQAALYEASLP